MSREGPFTKASVLLAVVALIVSYLLGAQQVHWWPFEPDAPGDGSGQSSPGGSPVVSSPPRTTARTEYTDSQSKANSATELAEFVIGYYRLMPDTSAGWPLIGPNLRTKGEASYVRFWGRFSGAEVLDPPTVDEPRVTVRIALRPRDGTKTLIERHLLTVAHYDGELRIDGDKYLGSS